jgi:hypothetical protein
MEFKRIKEEIERLNVYKSSDLISDNGMQLLAELKQALQLLQANVSMRSEQFYCLNRSVFGDGRKCDKQCLSCEKNIPKQ